MTNTTSAFAAFMVKDEETVVKEVVSDRFVDNKGKHIEWELKAINSDVDDLLRKESTKKIPMRGGQYKPELDMDKYMAKLCVRTTVYPNLNDAELQDFYGVKTAEDLLRKMLLPGEYIQYKTKVMEVNGFDLSMEELVDEAKN